MMFCVLTTLAFVTNMVCRRYSVIDGIYSTLMLRFCLIQILICDCVNLIVIGICNCMFVDVVKLHITRDFEDYFNILHELSAKCNLKDFSNIASNVNL